MPRHATKSAKKSATSAAPLVERPSGVTGADALGPDSLDAVRAAARRGSHAAGAAAVSPAGRGYAAQQAERSRAFAARMPVEVPGALREAGQTEEEGAFTQYGAEAAIDEDKHGWMVRQEHEREAAGPGRSVAKSVRAGDQRLRAHAHVEHADHAEHGEEPAAPAFDVYRREGNFVAANKSGVKRAGQRPCSRARKPPGRCARRLGRCTAR